MQYARDGAYLYDDTMYYLFGCDGMKLLLIIHEEYHPLFNELFVINVTENTGIINTAYGTVYICKKAT